MATGHGDASAQHARLDCEWEQGVKRLKMDPACLVAQAGSTKEGGEGIALGHMKQEPDEELWQGCEARRQPFLKVAETPLLEQGQAGCFQSPLEAGQQLRGYKIPLLLSGSIKKPQDTPLTPGRTVYKVVKAGFTGEVGREEVILSEDISSWDAERRRFREFCYYEAVGPRLTSVRLWTLCRQWLRPEKRTKEQILEQVILEQFLAILPRDMQSWVKAHHPNSCPRAVALAEGFLLIQEQKAQEALQKEAAGISKAEEPPLDSYQRPLASEIKQEDDSDPAPGSGTVKEIKEEDLSQEDSPMESPATAEGRAMENISSPSESGLVGDPKEEPGTTCSPDGGTVRKIKEENLSEEESLPEAAAPAEGRAQQSIAFPSGSALVRFPKEDPGTTCNPCDGTMREIKKEILSEEESRPEAPETAAGRAQRSSAFPSGSASVRLPKEEPGTTCNPDGGTVRKIKEENLSEEQSLPEAAAPAEGRAQQNIVFPSRSAFVGFPKEEPGTTCNPCDGTMREIKEEILSEEESRPEAHETAAGSAQRSSAFPSGSASVRLPKEEPGTTCNPGDGTMRELKEEILSEEESRPEAPVTAAGRAQRSSAFPSGSASVRLPKEEPGTTCNPDSLSSAPCKKPTVKSEEQPGKSGEPEAEGLVLGREEETRGTSGQEVAGEREEVWTGYGKTFRWKSVLTPCKETVTDWKIYQCCVCGNNYDARSIRAHQKMHTGERLYECIYCGRTFSQRSHFESHEKIHTGVKKVQPSENLYICVTCGKSFAYYSTLVAHKRSHGEEDASMTD